jgi:hypothetical protein
MELGRFRLLPIASPCVTVLEGIDCFVVDDDVAGALEVVLVLIDDMEGDGTSADNIRASDSNASPLAIVLLSLLSLLLPVVGDVNAEPLTLNT